MILRRSGWSDDCRSPEQVTEYYDFRSKRSMMSNSPPALQPLFRAAPSALTSVIWPHIFFLSLPRSSMSIIIDIRRSAAENLGEGSSIVMATSASLLGQYRSFQGPYPVPRQSSIVILVSKSSS